MHDSCAGSGKGRRRVRQREVPDLEIAEDRIDRGSRIGRSASAGADAKAMPWRGVAAGKRLGSQWHAVPVQLEPRAAADTGSPLLAKVVRRGRVPGKDRGIRLNVRFADLVDQFHRVRRRPIQCADLPHELLERVVAVPGIVVEVGVVVCVIVHVEQLGLVLHARAAFAGKQTADVPFHGAVRERWDMPVDRVVLGNRLPAACHEGATRARSAGRSEKCVLQDQGLSRQRDRRRTCQAEDCRQENEDAPGHGTPP